jgi:hypothetical protein
MSTRHDRIRTVRNKIERAKKHIGDLKAAVDAFFSTGPYEIRTDKEPDTARPIHYVAKVNPIPDDIPLILGDALHNLRSSLDHLAYGLVEANGRSPSNQTYFPICENLASYNAPKTVAKKTEGMSPEAKSRIDATKPYQGGNDLFWVLHKLNNIDKHCSILVAGSACVSVDLGGFMGRQMIREGLIPPGFPDPPPILSLFYKIGDVICPLKAGEIIFRAIANTEPDKDLQFGFDVAFVEPQIVQGKAIVKTVYEMANLVDSVFVQFEPLL